MVNVSWAKVTTMKARKTNMAPAAIDITRQLCDAMGCVSTENNDSLAHIIRDALRKARSKHISEVNAELGGGGGTCRAVVSLSARDEDIINRHCAAPRKSRSTVIRAAVVSRLQSIDIQH